jgi:hypothetical protein
MGNLSSTKGVGSGVFEFRIDFGPGFRIYFGQTATSSSCFWPVAINGDNSEISMRRSNIGQTTDARKAELERIRSIAGSLDELVRRDLAADPKLRIALHREALDAIRSGYVATGRSI